MTDLLLDTVGTFVARELSPAAALIDETDEVPAALVDTMAALGVVGLGDDDADLVDVLRVVEALAAGSAVVALLVVAPETAAGATRDRTGLRGVRSGVRAGVLAGCGPVTAGRRLALAAGAAAIGAAERALADTAKYLEQRQAFGSVLSDIPVLATLVSDRRAELNAARAALRECAGDSELRHASAVARAAARAAVTASLDAIQLHGGYGYTTEYQIERIARDCVSLRALIAELDDVTAIRTG